MKWIAIGAHLLRDDIEPLAEAVPVSDLFLSAIEVDDDQPIGDRELLLRVAGVRAKLLDAATFVALRYGFTFVSAGDARNKCGTHLDRWRGLIRRRHDGRCRRAKLQCKTRPKPSEPSKLKACVQCFALTQSERHA